MRCKIADITYKSIGVIHSPFKEQAHTPIQGVYSPESKGKIEIFKEYSEGLKDLEGFSHLYLIYDFHLAKEFTLKTKPFLDEKSRGVFATRYFRRPNSIGISVVRLEKVEGNILEISEVDIVDGTPLLDIKPCVPDFDQRCNVTTGWYTNASNKHQYEEKKEYRSALKILSKLGESRFKIATVSFGVFLSVFIVILLVGVITHTTLDALMTSITSSEILFAIKLSIITSIISTLACIIVSLPAAYALARYNFRGKSIINAILDMPLALPPLVAGVGLLILFGTTSFGKGLADAGIEFVFTPLGIVLAQFFVNMPFMFRILRSTFQSINPRYEYVAQTLGSTEMGAFFRVTLPMAKNGLMAGSIITWCRGIGEFGAALMVAGATRMHTETLPISLYLNMSSGDLPMAIASATILIALSLISLFIFEKFSGNAHVF